MTYKQSEHHVTKETLKTLAIAGSGFEPDMEFQAHAVVPIILTCKNKKSQYLTFL